MDFKIRPAESADIDALGRVYRAAFSNLLAGHYSDLVLAAAIPFLSKVDPTLISSGTYFIAIDSADAIVGAGGWSRHPRGGNSDDLARGHIRHFAVAPAFTRRGIGRALFNKCLAHAEGIQIFDCVSTIQAERFYRSLGFATSRKTEVILAKGVALSVVHMECRLDVLNQEEK